MQNINCLSFQLVCGISGNQGDAEVTWKRIDGNGGSVVTIYNTKATLADTTNYDIERPTGNLDYHNLVVRIMFLPSLMFGIPYMPNRLYLYPDITVFISLLKYQTKYVTLLNITVMINPVQSYYR